MVRGHLRQVYFIDLRRTRDTKSRDAQGITTVPRRSAIRTSSIRPPFHAVDLMPYGLASEDPDRDRECDCD